MLISSFGLSLSHRHFTVLYAAIRSSLIIASAMEVVIVIVTALEIATATSAAIVIIFTAAQSTIILWYKNSCWPQLCVANSQPCESVCCSLCRLPLPEKDNLLLQSFCSALGSNNLHFLCADVVPAFLNIRMCLENL